MTEETQSTHVTSSPQLDKPSFIMAIVLLLIAIIPMFVIPEQTSSFLKGLFSLITKQLGWAYILSGILVFGFLIWLGLSRFGWVKLGGAEDEVEFSDFSWAGMLFCAGVGAGMLFWAVIEWGWYFTYPPHGIEARSTSAMDWASSMGLFHWGPMAWAFYCLPAVTIAYPFYVKKIPFLRLSTSLYGLFGERAIRGPLAKFVDIMFIISLLGGAGYSLGVSTPMISAGFAYIAGIDFFALSESKQLTFNIFTALFCVTVFSISTYFGLSKGIKLLSDLNVRLALGLVAFILIAGPTVFIIKTSISGLGFMVSEFARMSTWMDPFTGSGFVEDWTVFYWAWWIAYAPFVGLFVTRISCGRTIRQLIFGMLVYGTAGGMMFFMIMGNYSMSLTINNVVDIATILNEQGGVQAIIATLNQLPIPTLVVGTFCLVSVIFCATTYDSASYIIASTATKELHAGQDPVRWHRLFWAFALSALPIALMYIDQLKVMQSVLIVVSLPILIIGILSAISLVKSLNRDFPAEADKTLIIRPRQLNHKEGFHDEEYYKSHGY